MITALFVLILSSSPPATVNDMKAGDTGWVKTGDLCFAKPSWWLKGSIPVGSNKTDSRKIKIYKGDDGFTVDATRVKTMDKDTPCRFVAPSSWHRIRRFVGSSGG